MSAADWIIDPDGEHTRRIGPWVLRVWFYDPAPDDRFSAPPSPWADSDARTETRDYGDSITMLVRAWGSQFRAAFYRPDGPEVQDWRDGEITAPRPDGQTVHTEGPLAGHVIYWPDRQSARDACEAAYAAWVKARTPTAPASWWWSVCLAGVEECHVGVEGAPETLLRIGGDRCADAAEGRTEAMIGLRCWISEQFDAVVRSRIVQEKK